MGHAGGVDSLNIECINDNFIVNINYNGSQIYMKATAFVGLKNNRISFEFEDFIIYGDVYNKAVSNFEKLNLHLALKCENKECASNYFICSDLLRCGKRHLELDRVNSTFEIEPFKLYMESFVIDDIWIQNLWNENKTCIYSIEKYENDPIEIDLIDWSEMNYNKIISKIQTIVTFS